MKNLGLMTGFGLLTVLLGHIRFVIPGMEGGGSDMREIGILLSILFLPNWIYMLGVSFIGSLSIPPDSLEISTIMMHCTASVFGWFFYSKIKEKTKNIYYLSGLWAVMVVAYYIIFLIPTLVLVFYLFSVIGTNEIVPTYKNVLYAYRFELFTSIAVTTLFLALYRTARLLETKNRELEKALQKSQESDRLKSAFINNINHEIRTPLNGIIGFTRLLVDPGLDSDTRAEYSKSLISSSNRLLSVILNIISISKIKTGQVTVRREPVRLKELLDDLYLYYSSLAREKNLGFEIDHSDIGDGEIIISDRESLKQILDNLLNNAFKFTRKGGISVHCTKADKLVTFAVKDSGSGIDPAFHNEIFNSFSKVENGADEFLPGTGLGLSISRNLVELLGGKITVESSPGKGSIFTFSIPAGQI